jgi:hypothetical protein
MSKKTIGALYFIGVLVELVGVYLVLANLANYASDVIAQGWVYIGIIILVLGGIPGLIAWIGALVNLSRAQLWAWFVLMFFFGGIMLLIYLLSDPQPLKAGQTPPAQQLAASPPLPYPPGIPSPPPAQAYQLPQPGSPLDILQQRYARGEIDTATYDEMRARLEGRLQQ